MQDLLINYLEQLQFGQKQSYKNLAVYPLVSEYAVSLDYLTLDEAMSQDAIDVVEIDKGGSVPELKVINNSGKMILILDGEELVGANYEGCPPCDTPVEDTSWGSIKAMYR